MQFHPPSYSGNKLQNFFFTWCYYILRKGYRKPLEQADLCNVDQGESADKNYQLYHQNKQQGEQRLISDLYTTFQRQMIITFIPYFIVAILSSVSPYVSNIGQTYFIYEENESKPSANSMGRFVGLQLIYMLAITLIKPYQMFEQTILSVKIQGALQQQLIQKSLTFNMQLQNEHSSGELLTMLQVDIVQASNYFIYLFSLITAIPQLIVGGVIFYITLKDNSIVPAVGAIVQAIFGLIFGHYYGVIQKRFMEAKDLRIKLVDESLVYAKQIKFNCLEEFFEQRIKEQRKIELKYLKYQVWMVIAIRLVMLIIMVLSWEIAFVVAKELNFQIVSTMMQNYMCIVLTLDSLPTLFKNYQMSKNSIQRIESFYLSKDVKNYFRQNADKVAIKFDNVQVTWKKHEKQLALQDLDSSQTEMIQLQQIQKQFQVALDIQIKQGEFIAIVGSSGSGKSTLMRSILGETFLDKGTIEYCGVISIASQEPWIINDSLRNNITYLQQFDQEKYNKIIECCSLQQDIDGFKHKDQTILVEKGDNLSGGQQKRINLARATYKDADIYLLDDPLSALDIKVRYEIQSKCFEQYLKNKTRILFTNSLANLQNCDMIYLIDDGKIINQGTFAELKNIKQSQILINKQEQKELLNIKFEEQVYKPAVHNQLETQATLIQNEDRQAGNVELKVMKQIFQYLGRWWMIVLIVVYLGIVLSCQLLGNSKLADESVSEADFKGLAIFYYPIIQIPVMIANVIVIVYFLYRGLSTSENIHESVIKSLLRASFTKFYNTVLIGRLINRLGKDITNIDYLFPNEMINFIFNIVSLLLPLVASIVYLNPIALPILIVFFVILIFITIVYYRSLREVTRMEAISKSPIVSYFQQILRGVLYVRNCIDKQLIIDNHLKNVDVDFGNSINLNGLQQWYQSTAGSITNIFQAILFVVCFFFEGSTPRMTYLVLLQMQSVSSLLLLVAVQYGNLLMYCVSFERCLHLANQIELEDEKYDYISNENASIQNDHLIVLDKCSFQYRPRSKQVLRKLTLTVDKGEKIGIVGRTGAGKSSIIMALMKMLEQVDGIFKIKGDNVAKLTLKELRSRFSIIPQEPLIFMGSLKDNLDPLKKCSDQEIFQAAEICNLFKLDAFKRNEMLSEISVQGQNLGVGEKQLITLARCLLEKKEIILVDEATANIDSAAEEIVNKIFETQFKDKSMIMIAHKVTTIMTSNKIVVLSDGGVVENDSPQNLLLNPNSEFKKIVDLIEQSEQL